MKLTIATDFDRNTREEVFQVITISQTTAKNVIEERLNELDYDERRGFVKKFAVKPVKKKKKHATDSCILRSSQHEHTYRCF